MSRPREGNLEDQRAYLAVRTDELIRQRARQLGVSRRRLLQLLGAGSVGGVLGGFRPPRAAAGPAADLLVKPTPAELFIDHKSNQEMRWEAMYGRGYLVPNELFFIRDHSRTPRIDVATWRLTVEGPGVQRPLELTYEDIVAMPSTSVIRYVECAGNGRSFFEKAYGRKAQGTQWKLGGVGVAEWTGVPLGEILDRAGLERSAKDVMPQGLDDLKVRRPMSVTKALAEDTLLVYAMNGEPLPPDHGFPVRVLTPGWIGVQNVKWVGRIEVSDQPLFSPWNTDSYILIGPDYQPNPPARGPILTTQSVKSALELPWEAKLAPGRHLIKGRSWSPFGTIAKVEYSLDRGASWQEAQLSEPNIAQAWVRWTFTWDAKPGPQTIRVRATDDQGHVQPDSVPWNEQGYLYNAVVDHPVAVG